MKAEGLKEKVALLNELEMIRSSLDLRFKDL